MTCLINFKAGAKKETNNVYEFDGNQE
jgi:hypothetical protein